MANQKVTAAHAQNKGLENLYTDEGDGTHSPNVRVRGGAITSTPAASELHLGQVGGQIIEVSSGELTRPANTDAYAAKDAVGPTSALLTFTDLARVTGGTGYITKARIITDQKTLTARFRLHLFNAAPTAIADNAPFLLLYADASKRIGYIDFPAFATEDATNSTAAVAQNILDRLPFVAVTKTLHGVLETLDVFTPASAQKFIVYLTADVN